MRRPQVAGKTADRVAADNRSGRHVQHAVFGPQFLHRCASALGVCFAKDLLEIAREQLPNAVCGFGGLQHREVSCAKDPALVLYRMQWICSCESRARFVCLYRL
ncbi:MULTISPECIES: hypothetical protein [unclassified Sphingomonas]|uniref:hypothetical protein n=1 Tax=unclassified Sphingomonas TaxID=196159 RepID=UPI00226A3692|nr:MULTISPECIES: hypothetical protein [unclassified Sphingomonas]